MKQDMQKALDEISPMQWLMLMATLLITGLMVFAAA